MHRLPPQATIAFANHVVLQVSLPLLPQPAGTWSTCFKFNHPAQKFRILGICFNTCCRYLCSPGLADCKSSQLHGAHSPAACDPEGRQHCSGLWDCSSNVHLSTHLCGSSRTACRSLLQSRPQQLGVLRTWPMSARKPRQNLHHMLRRLSDIHSSGKTWAFRPVASRLHMDIPWMQA